MYSRTSHIEQLETCLDKENLWNMRNVSSCGESNSSPFNASHRSNEYNYLIKIVVSQVTMRSFVAMGCNKTYASAVNLHKFPKEMKDLRQLSVSTLWSSVLYVTGYYHCQMPDSLLTH